MHRTTSSRRRVAVALATASVAALSAGTTAAHADSIVFVKGGDVFRATPDGSRVQQVTSTGGYSSVSQDDAGRMVALHGDKLAHIDRDGSIIADIATPAQGSADGQDFEGVYDPQLSPNGKRVSYTYYWRWVTNTPGCQPQFGCYVNKLYHGTAYTDPDRLTAWDEPGFHRQTGWIHGSWLDDDTQLLSDPSMKPNDDLVLHRPDLDKNEPDSLQRWAEDVSAKQMEDGEMTRDRSKLAFVTGASQETVWFYDARNAFYPDYPEVCRTFQLANAPGGRFHDLSWSPDGTTLAYADADGVNTFHLPDFGPGKGECGTATEDTKLVLPGASSPDWGPADLPADAPAPPSGGGGTGGGTGGASPQPGTSPGGPVTTPGPGGAPGGTVGSGGTRPGSDVGAGSGSRPGVSAATGTGSGGTTASGPGGTAATATPGVSMTLARTTLGGALRSGLKVRFSGAGAGQRTFLARTGGRIVARGKVRIGADGAGRVTLRFTAAGRKRLAHKRSARFLITGPGASLTATLKR